MTANSERIAEAAKRRSDWLASLQMLPGNRPAHPYDGDSGLGYDRVSDAMVLANAYLDGLPEVEKIKDQVDELRGVLANLSLYLSAGSGDDSTTPAEFEKRIRWGIDEVVRIERERACRLQK